MVTTDEPVLRITRVSKQYGGVTALHDVSLDLRPGEVLGLVGDNGAGKSTLMRIIAGVQPPSSGRIEIDGRVCQFGTPSQAVDAGISTVYQDLALAMQRDVVANFFLGREVLVGHWLGRRLGWLDRRTMKQRTEHELAQLHTRLPDVDVICKQLSGGQRQALAIARAAAWCRRVLLLDEPTSALGVKQQHEVLELIGRIRDRGVAIILVSHQMQDVINVCDRAVVLRLGRVAARLDQRQLTVDNLIGYITGALVSPDAAEIDEEAEA